MSVQYLEIRKDLIAACHTLLDMNYLIGTYGNVSARVTGGLIITPSRIDYQALTPADMVMVSDEGKVIDSKRLPSSELEVHRRIYLRRPDVQAITHTHSLLATALSCLHQTIPVIAEEQSQVIGGEIPCTHYVPAGQHEKLGLEVAEILGASNAVLLANHGVVCCGRSVEEAIFTSQITERIAQMYLLTCAAGQVIPIPPDYVQSERHRWLYKYGKAEDWTDH